MMSVRYLFFLLIATLSATPNACEVPVEVRQALDSLDRRSGEMNYAERIAYKRKTLDELLAKHPRDIAVQRKYAEFVKRETSDAFPALRQKYVEAAEHNPQDAFAVYMAGYALQEYKTPEALRLTERAKSLDPTMPWTYITLASLYGRGKFEDKAKASENIAAYYQTCPASLEELPLLMIGRRLKPDQQREVVKAIRARLEAETDPSRLRRYAEVWNIEFQTTPIPEHPALRKRIAADVKRLEALNTKPDAEWLDFLKNGMKQSGASQQERDTVDERILRDFPSSSEARQLVTERWRTAHPEPKPDASAGEWDSYRRAYFAALERWVHQFPNNTFYLRHAMLQVYPPPVPRKTAIELSNGLLKGAMAAYGGPTPYDKARTAEFLLRQNVEPKRAVVLLVQSLDALTRTLDKPWWRENDVISEKEVTRLAKYARLDVLNTQTGLLRACLRSKNATEARKLKIGADDAIPKDRYEEAEHWERLALLAEIQGRGTDALTYYQRALHVRPKAPSKRFGRVEDPLLDEARTLWRATGGTDAAWELWSKPPNAARELTEGRWERPEKDLPPFELADLTGKKWNSRDLVGKTIFINLWATWCGPCNAELPHLQKLSEMLKGRNDVVLLSFNVDEELGLVEPFVKDKAFTFPVLPANAFVKSVLDAISIPRNWIVDAKGKWCWEQIGFDSSESNWEASVLAKIEPAK